MAQGKGATAFGEHIKNVGESSTRSRPPYAGAAPGSSSWRRPEATIPRGPPERGAGVAGRSRSRLRAIGRSRPPVIMTDIALLWIGRKRSLTPHQQREARERLAGGETQRSVARSYDVSQAAISRLEGDKGEAMRDIPPP